MDTSLIPSDIQNVMARLHAGGYAVWLVGGALRDAMRGAAPQDWDLATDATPAQVMALFPRVIPIGIRHGTVQIHTPTRDIEVTHCPAPAAQGIMQDLARRDFTINAMALGFPSGELIDPHGGRKDLQLGLLRAVGSPAARFAEDPLRTLRAGRFMSVLGFRLHPATRTALPRAAAGLAGVAQERIRTEMLKLLLGKHFASALDSMQQGGVLDHVLPELLDRLDQDGVGRTTFCSGSRYQHTLRTVQHTPPRQRLRLAALLHALGRPAVPPAGDIPACCAHYRQISAQRADQVMLRWRMSRKDVSQTGRLIASQLSWPGATWTAADARRLIAAVGSDDWLEDLFDLATADCTALGGDESLLQSIADYRSRVKQQLQQPLPLHITDLAVNGNDLVRTLGLKPGPWVGIVLRQLHGLVLQDPGLNSAQTLKNILVEKHSRHPEIFEK